MLALFATIASSLITGFLYYSAYMFFLLVIALSVKYAPKTSQAR